MKKTNLPKNLIFLSASFKSNKGDRKKIEEDIFRLKEKKKNSQHLSVKTGGSTFKNPKNQSQKKAWEIIKENVDCQISFGDASISDKHANFFVNKKKQIGLTKNNQISFLKNFNLPEVKEANSFTKDQNWKFLKIFPLA